jgi:hypothetical protein
MRRNVPPDSSNDHHDRTGNPAGNPRILLADHVHGLLNEVLLENWLQGRFKTAGWILRFLSPRSNKPHYQKHSPPRTSAR